GVHVVPIDAAEAGALGVSGAALPHAGALVVGRFSSFDLATRSATGIGFLLATPRNAPSRPPVVLLLHGLGGGGARQLVAFGAPLLAAGPAVGAFALPSHASRSTGRDPLEVLHPETVALLLRQGAVDTVAFAAALARRDTLPPEIRVAATPL